VPEIDVQPVVLPSNSSFKAKSLSSSCISLHEGISMKKEDDDDDDDVEHILFEDNVRDEINPSE